MFTIGRHRSLLRVLLLAVLVAPGALSYRAQAMTTPDSPPVPVRVRSASAAFPLPLVENVGQFDPQVAYAALGPAGGLWLTRDSIWVSAAEPSAGLPDADYIGARQVSLRLTLAGADLSRPEPLDRDNASVNYLLGDDPELWKENVPAWEAVVYRDVYPGYDLEISRSGPSGWDWRLVPQGNARHGLSSLPRAQVLVEGADSLYAGDDEWLAGTDIGTLFLPRLTGSSSAPALLEGESAGLDAPVTSVVGPTETQAAGASVYATLPGAATDQATAMAKDSSGNLYLTGYTSSPAFPATDGAWDGTFAGMTDVFAVKLGADGSLVYATYLGGTGEDRGMGIAVDSGGNAYLTGHTSSDNFPTTSGAFQSSNLGGHDLFVTKLNATGSDLVYSTYLGKSGDDRGQAIAVHSDGRAYVTGYTSSTSFYLANYPCDGHFQGETEAFVTSLNVDGRTLNYSTYLGGSGDDRAYGIALDSEGNAHVTGSTNSDDFPGAAGGAQTGRAGGDDVFVAKVVSSGTALGFSTYLGGTQDDCGLGIALDDDGRAHVTGYTASSDFPTTLSSFDRTHDAGRDAFFARFNSYGDVLEAAGFVGGRGEDRGRDIALDPGGDMYVAGISTSVDFPVTANAFRTSIGSSTGGFLSRVSADGSTLKYSSYVGQAADGVAATTADHACLCGREATGAFVGCLQTDQADLLYPEFALVEDLVVITDGGDHWPPRPGDTITAQVKFTNAGVGWLDVARVGVRCLRNGSASCDFWYDGTLGMAAGVETEIRVPNNQPLLVGSYSLQTSYSSDGSTYQETGNVVSFVVAEPTATPTVTPTATQTVVPTATPMTATPTPTAPGASTVYLPLTLRTQ